MGVARTRWAIASFCGSKAMERMIMAAVEAAACTIESDARS